jgi:hypothetical protein
MTRSEIGVYKGTYVSLWHSLTSHLSEMATTGQCLAFANVGCISQPYGSVNELLETLAEQ